MATKTRIATTTTPAAITSGSTPLLDVPIVSWQSVVAVAHEEAA